jgi:hypothetical protein
MTGLEAIHAELPILKPLIDPWLAPGELVVIYGRNTRARTLFAMTAAYAAAFGGYVAGFPGQSASPCGCSTWPPRVVGRQFKPTLAP